MPRVPFYLAFAVWPAGLPGHSQNLTEHYRPMAEKLIDAALVDQEGYDRLTYLCHRIGRIGRFLAPARRLIRY
jgi:hypothetical protein